MHTLIQVLRSSSLDTSEFSKICISVTSQVISTACCVFYSHCGSRTLSRDKSIDRRTANWVAFSLWRKQNEDNTLISKLLRMHKFNDQICPSWFAPVRSASDYPPSVRACISLLFIYCSIFILVCLLQLASNGSEHSNIISPVYSFWAIFIGLCMANYVVEWSTGYVYCLNTFIW